MISEVLVRWFNAMKGVLGIRGVRRIFERGGRNVGSEAIAGSKASCSRVQGAQPPENF